MSSSSPAAPRGLVLLPVLFGLATQWQVLRSDFSRDDFLHMYDIANDGVMSFLFSPYGGHFYLFRNLIFAVTYESFGLWAPPYFLSVIAVHVVNTVLFFRVLARQTGSPPVAALAAAVWSSSPMHIQTMEWYSAFGHPLSATMLLLALTITGDVRSGGGRWWWAFLLLFLGSTCYGVGIGVALAFPLAIWLRQGAVIRSRAIVLFVALAATVPLLYFASPLLSAHFDTADRLDDMVTKAEVWTWPWIVGMFAHLVSYGAGSLAFVSSLLLAFGQVLRLPLSLLALGALFAAIVLTDRASVRMACAWLLFAASAYGMIALGRAWFYVDVQRDFWIAASEPRYHYVGQLGLCAAAAVAAASLVRRFPSTRIGRVAAAAALAVCLLNVRNGWHHELWPSGRPHLARAQQLMSERVLERPPGTTVCMVNEDFAGVDFWVVGLRGERFPGVAAVYLLWDDPELARRRVRFVEQKPRVLDYVRRRHGRIRDVLVGPGECEE